MIFQLNKFLYKKRSAHKPDIPSMLPPDKFVYSIYSACYFEALKGKK